MAKVKNPRTSDEPAPYRKSTAREYFESICVAVILALFVRTFVVEADGATEHIKKFFVGEKSTGEVSFTVVPKDAKPGTKGESVKPRFLGGDELAEPELPEGFKEPKVEPKRAPPTPLLSRSEKVCEWMTPKENPYLARATVTRI